MKKPAFPVVWPLALLAIGVGLVGCPIYDQDDAGCYVNSDCAAGYLCDDASGACYREDNDACRKPTDCRANETCSRSGSCVAGDCHYDSVGCIRGFVCSSESGRWECVDEDDATGGNGGAGGEGGAAKAGASAAGQGGGSEGGAAGHGSSAGTGG
jgi:hypothetical protein